jgi:hypothetical protein
MPEEQTAADLRTQFLASVPLFDGIPEVELAELSQLLRQREFAAGEVLWREGEEAADMVLILEGQVALSLSLPGETDGRISSRRQSRTARRSPAHRWGKALGHGSGD